MILRKAALPFLAVVLLMLAGCGFHPRAELQVPDGLGPVKIVTASPNTPLYIGLDRAFDRVNAIRAKATDKDVASLNILQETWRSEPLSVDAFAHINEYIFTYTVRFSFTSADGTELLPPQEARLQRDFQYDDLHALGSGAEQQTIHDEMQRDMAAMIIRQLGIVLRHVKS